MEYPKAKTSRKRPADDVAKHDAVIDAAVSLTNVDAKIDDVAPPSEEPVTKKPRSEAVPPAVEQKQIRSKYVFYPDMYDTFDSQKISFGKDPQVSRDGSGEILFMSYLFDDGLQPLLLQTPNAMHSPTGITTWKDGKSSILLSTGREWDSAPLMIKFKALIDSIQQRCIETVCAKGWNKGCPNTPEEIKACFTDLMFVGTEAESGTPYPPSIKATVLIDGPSKAELFEKVVHLDGTTALNCLIPSDVPKGCGTTAIIQIPWIFRKKAQRGRGWNFSIRATLYQARIFPPAAQGSLTRGGCAVVE